MSKTAALCVPDGFRKVLGHILENQGYTGQSYSINDLYKDFPNLDSQEGIFCIWAEELRSIGSSEGIAWLTHLRIDDPLNGRPRRAWQQWPVLLLGLSPWWSFFRSLDMPRILGFPGWLYIQLPCRIEMIKQAVQMAQPSPGRDELRKYLHDPDRLKHVESLAAHSLGNHFALFRLLEGAVLSEVVPGNLYKSIRGEVEEIHRQELRQKKADDVYYQEFLFLREPLRSALTNSTPYQPIARGRKILLIDDEAKMGWARVLSCLLVSNGQFSEKSQGDLYTSQCSSFKAIGCSNPMDPDGEAEFIAQLTTWVSENKQEIQKYDLILLDLRLQRERDENIPEANCSGVKILDALRKINAGIPIVIFTASRKAESAKAVFDHGADEFFVKDPGEAKEADSDRRQYYDRFKSVIDKALERWYLRDLWKGIESVSPPAAEFLHRAFALLRIEPSDFNTKLGFSPYAGAIVDAYSAIEESHLSMSGWPGIFSTHSEFLRNNCAHPQSSLLITELDARIAFLMALGFFNLDWFEQNAIKMLRLESEEHSIDWITRSVFSYMRKRLNLLSDPPMNPFETKSKTSTNNEVFKSDLHKTYVSFLLQPSWFARQLPKKNVAPYLAILRAAFSRLQQLTSNETEPFNPAYVSWECIGNYRKIYEAFWDGRNWVVPTTTSTPIVLTNKKRPSAASCTQPFKCTHAADYRPWGPTIPYGDHTEDALKKMLSINHL